ncbi:MAG: 1-acyl-sn-glycerol-3-phosphate acyltransferase [Myxococcota bacterium]
MPAGIMIEAGQADLMLISYLGIDALNRGERVYRLLGCQLTYHDDLPRPGETLAYDVHVDGHAQQGAERSRLFFFHYDCRVDGALRLSVRNGQAGFFTDDELAESAGVIWDPSEVEIVDDPRLDPPVQQPTRSRYDAQQVRAFASGRPWECFGPGYELSQTHNRTPRIDHGKMLFIDQVTQLATTGGPWGRGYLRAVTSVHEDDWYFAGHFKNDPCMPGTLMFEGCLQTMAFYMTAMGFTLERDGWRFQPVSGEPFDLRCRGQVLPESKNVTYELFVEEVVAGPIPTLYADLLCTVDGLKAFHAKRVGLQLVPDWPLSSRPELLRDHVETKPVACAGDFAFDYASLLACAWGKPSDAFGDMYRVFDGHRRAARLPGPPYHFMSRVTRIEGDIGACEPGAEIELEYDIPPDAWYFDANGNRTMPFAILLEAALQPCGWLASYVGSALSVSEDLAFRNLDGTGTLTGELFSDAGTLRTRVRLANVSKSAGMIIESFDVECYLCDRSHGDRKVYELQTVFGFFPPAALKNQVGLPTTAEQRAELDAPSDFFVDLTRRVASDDTYCGGRLRLADAQLLMLDRITGFWPEGGSRGLGRLRAEKDVDPSEWFFKAHFFQDPVQPGSLGLEALLQLLQFYMLEAGMQAGVERPRFEPVALDMPLTWKYRGQVVPTNGLISTTIDIVETGRDERGPYAVAEGSLWVDGKRIYETSRMGMRITSGDPPGGVVLPGTELLDPEVDTWLQDHRPTWTVPALPMMAMVDRLAAAVEPDEQHVVGFRDVTVKRWLVCDRPRRLRVERSGDNVRLLASTDDAEAVEEEIASGRVLIGRWSQPPAALPPLDGTLADSPYDAGLLFHGPAFQLLERLVLGEHGSSSLLDAGRSGVPPGRLNPALLDAATHGIPHDRLHLWSSDIDSSMVAYPALLRELDLYGPTPTEGKIRCEARFDGFFAPGMPAFVIQLIVQGKDDERVWMQMRLVEACFPKGPLGSAEPSARRTFLRDRRFVAGVSLSRRDGETTHLDATAVESSDWLPGTVVAIYGSREPEEIAVKEHLAVEHQLHPGILPQALPLTHAPVDVRRDGDRITVRSSTPATLDITPVKKFWANWFDRDPWPVEDLYYGLIERFVRRVVLADPEAFEAVKGHSLLYLANHQTGVESLLFSILASGLGGVPTVTLAKAEHRCTWLGRLIAHCFTYPGIADPQLLTFFDRDDKTSLPRIIEQLGAQMAGPGKSVMVHVEGTRALSCREPVQKMSGAFVDMALEIGAPIVPIRFVGGLPIEPLACRIEFPINMGKQDLWIGRPILPDELSPLPYGERKALVIGAINGLGPANALEAPLEADPEFEGSVHRWMAESGASLEHAVLFRTLQHARGVCPDTEELVAAASSRRIVFADDARGRWLTTLAERLCGTST